MRGTSGTPSSGINRSDVERSVEDDHEQAVLAASWRVVHRRARGEVGVGACPKDLAVRRHLTVQHDDRVGRAVAMAPGTQARRITDEVVLGSGAVISVEQPQANRAIVDLGLGWPQSKSWAAGGT